MTCGVSHTGSRSRTREREEQMAKEMMYRPKGKAQEYAESVPGAGDGLAVNLYKGCPHRCKYCYVPLYMPWRKEADPREAFHGRCESRLDARQLERDCVGLGDNRRPIHLCFTCDPYPGSGVNTSPTREALEILARHQMRKVQLLTKGGTAAMRDFDLLKQYGMSFGSTVVFVTPEMYAEWEPGAEDRFSARKEAIAQAKDMGIGTWVSVEPVIDVEEALEVMSRLLRYVDVWKVGKINHGEHISEELGEIERKTDWPKFVSQTKKVLRGKRLLFKKSLQYWA